MILLFVPQQYSSVGKQFHLFIILRIPQVKTNETFLFQLLMINTVSRATVFIIKFKVNNSAFCVRPNKHIKQ